MIIQFCGMSGAGKTTLCTSVQSTIRQMGLPIEIIDGDEYRNGLCRDLDFSKAGRVENIRRLGFVAGKLSSYGVISLICAINPYECARRQIKEAYPNVFTVFVDCALSQLTARDTKGLYKRALLPDGHPQKISNLTGVNDPFEKPGHPDLYLDTGVETVSQSSKKLVAFILNHQKSHTLQINNRYNAWSPNY